MSEDRCCGAKKDSSDYNDLKKRYYSYRVPSTQSSPVDLRPYVDHIYDQGKLESCTANAVCSAFRIDLKMQGYEDFDPSRRFLYYNTREVQSYSLSSGLSIRNTLKAMSRYGVCSESSWPYTDSYVWYNDKPPQSCYKAAKVNALYKYKRLEQDIGQLRACLSKKRPFVFGFKVYDGFIKNMRKCGCMPLMTKNDRSSYSSSSKEQAVVAVGFDDQSKVIICLNSWGKGWGDGGYFYMPYDFITDTNMCFDFWKITFACQRDKPRLKDPVSPPVLLGSGSYSPPPPYSYSASSGSTGASSSACAYGDGGYGSIGVKEPIPVIPVPLETIVPWSMETTLPVPRQTFIPPPLLPVPRQTVIPPPRVGAMLPVPRQTFIPPPCVGAMLPVPRQTVIPPPRVGAMLPVPPQTVIPPPRVGAMLPKTSPCIETVLPAALVTSMLPVFMEPPVEPMLMETAEAEDGDSSDSSL